MSSDRSREDWAKILFETSDTIKDLKHLDKGILEESLKLIPEDGIAKAHDFDKPLYGAIRDLLEYELAKRSGLIM